MKVKSPITIRVSGLVGVMVSDVVANSEGLKFLWPAVGDSIVALHVSRGGEIQIWLRDRAAIHLSNRNCQIVGLCGA